MSLPLRRGVHAPLEREADRMIRESLKGVTKHSEKSDILTAWKEAERHRREVYCADGVPDSSNRKGLFHRSLNPARPDLNSRDGVTNRRSSRTGALQAHINEYGVPDAD